MAAQREKGLPFCKICNNSGHSSKNGCNLLKERGGDGGERSNKEDAKVESYFNYGDKEYWPSLNK